MDYQISYAEALSLWPGKVAEARAALDASKSKKRSLADQDLEWKVSLGVRVEALSAADLFGGSSKPKAAPSWKAPVSESMRETDPQGYCDAKIASGEFMASLACAGQYFSSPLGPGDAAPKAMVEGWRVQPAPQSPSSGPAIYVKNGGAKIPGIHESKLAGIYEKGSGSSKEIVAVPEDGAMLLLLDLAEGTAGLAGGFAPGAWAAFDACAPGGSFKYRNKPMRRWSDAEVAAFLASGPKVWAHSMGVYGFGAKSPAPGDLSVSPSDPVYADGADMHPNPKPMGTAASLGLCPVPVPPKAKP